jgi:hypothetical protein
VLAPSAANVHRAASARPIRRVATTAFATAFPRDPSAPGWVTIAPLSTCRRSLPAGSVQQSKVDQPKGAAEALAAVTCGTCASSPALTATRGPVTRHRTAWLASFTRAPITTRSRIACRERAARQRDARLKREQGDGRAPGASAAAARSAAPSARAASASSDSARAVAASPATLTRTADCAAGG